MGCGLYGKLPAKRDFIAEAIPRAALDRLEVWLQGGLSASRLTLGARWQSLYYSAPIWRFWLAPNFCGQAVLGALMPSIDGVGRSFPLVLVALAPPGNIFVPPQDEPQEEWFGAVESLLLAALEESTSFEVTLETLRALPDPLSIPRPELPSGLRMLPDGLLRAEAGEGDVGSVLAGLAAGEARTRWGRGCVFWTIGGNGIPAQALTAGQMPEGENFTLLFGG